MHTTVKHVQLANIGTSFEFLITDEDGIVDLSGSSFLQVVLEKPDETTITRAAAIVNDGTDGLMEYVTVDGDLDQTGVWKIQGRIVFPTADFRTVVNLIRVYDNLPQTPFTDGFSSGFEGM